MRPLIAFVVLVGAVRDGERDNQPDNVRPIPPPGVAVPEADRAELLKGLEELGREIETVRTELRGKPALDLLPDVQVYHKAVQYAVQYNEIFNLREIPVARSLLKQGLDRARQLRDGKPAWPAAPGLVVRGYVSRIDGSIQPYGLVVPASWRPDTSHRYRVDCWFHGRGETLSELNFVDPYPNPLNPKRYVVLNSGFTFRDYDYLNNARQVPKLPDWAVADVATPPDSRWPGKVVAADFFDEEWKLK